MSSLYRSILHLGSSVDAALPLVYEPQCSIAQRLLRTLNSLHNKFTRRHLSSIIHRNVSICLNERPFQVRENLYLAMRAIRNRMNRRQIASTLLWVDALCINQGDPVERSHQFNMMSKIYSQAQLVVVWLGLEAGNSRLAMRYIKKVSRFMRPGTAMDNHAAPTRDITHLLETHQPQSKEEPQSQFRTRNWHRNGVSTKLCVTQSQPCVIALTGVVFGFFKKLCSPAIFLPCAAQKLANGELS